MYMYVAAGGYLTGVVNALQIQLLNKFYERFSRTLTEYGMHACVVWCGVFSVMKDGPSRHTRLDVLSHISDEIAAPRFAAFLYHLSFSFRKPPHRYRVREQPDPQDLCVQIRRIVQLLLL